MSERIYTFDNAESGCGCGGNNPLAMAALLNGGNNNQWNNPLK